MPKKPGWYTLEVEVTATFPEKGWLLTTTSLTELPYQEPSCTLLEGYTVTVGPAYPDSNALGSGYNPGKYGSQTQPQTAGQFAYNPYLENQYFNPAPQQAKPMERQEKQTTLGDMAKCKVCGGFYPGELGECPDDHEG